MTAPCRRSLVAAVLVGMLAAVAAMTSNGGGLGRAYGDSTQAGRNRASAPGVTARTVIVGMLTSVTGPNASAYPGAVAGTKARLDLQNAEGGVHGRRIDLVVGDDQSTLSSVVPAVENMVANQHAFAILAETGLFFLAAHYLQQNGVPVVGSSADGSEWYIKPYTNMFSFSPSTRGYPAYSGTAAFMKARGVTNVASLGYGISPSSAAAARGFALSAEKEGMKVGYLDTSVPFAGVNVTTDVLAMTKAHVNGLYLPLAFDTNLAMILGAKQAGLDLKVALSATGYGSTLLSQPTAVQAMQGAYFSVSQTPVELKTPATRVEQAALERYAHFTGVPDFGYTIGWLSADLFVKGLEVAGRNPTRQSFMTALRKVTHYDAGGLLPQAVDLSKAFGNPPRTTCGYIVRLEGRSFVPTPSDGKPVCGTIVGNG
ncbi:MAG TPA: ABC transporter substrate-binding protein [Acidimicrobiales bacterium]|nr:ABC transporter substrate-binding protein [Acidimicrobiales bacterium]